MKSLHEEITYKKYEETLNKLIASNKLGNEEFSLFIFGQGAQTRMFYLSMRFNKAVEYVWSGWPLPFYTLPFSFIPGQYGLLKIIDISKTKELFDEVGEQSCCSLCYFNKKLENQFTEYIKSNKFRADPHTFFENEKEYFVFEILFDNSNYDENLVISTVTYGEDLDNELKKILSLKDLN